MIMQDEKKLPSDASADTAEEAEQLKEQKISAFQQTRMKEAQTRRANELAERERQAAAEEAAYQAREEYAKSLNEDKIDLIRLKQGVIEDSDKVFPHKEPEKKYTVAERIGNWLYHSKWWLGIACFCVFIIGFLVYDHLTKVDPDLNLLLVSHNYEIYLNAETLSDMLEKDCPDYNEDKKVLASVVYVPASKATMEGGGYTASYSTNLLVQMQSDMCMLMICDEGSDAYLEPDNMFVNLAELYPDYDFIDGYRVRLDQTSFSQWLGLKENLNPGTYLALRMPSPNMSGDEEMQAAYDKAIPVLESLLEQLASAPPAPELSETESST